MPGLTVSVDNGMGEPRSLAPRDWTFTAPSNSSTPSQREALNLAGVAATRSAVAARIRRIPRRCRTRSRVRHLVRPCRHIGTARFDRKRRRWQFQRRVRLGNSRQFWGQRQSRGQSEPDLQAGMATATVVKMGMATAETMATPVATGMETQAVAATLVETATATRAAAATPVETATPTRVERE